MKGGVGKTNLKDTDIGAVKMTLRGRKGTSKDVLEDADNYQRAGAGNQTGG